MLPWFPITCNSMPFFGINTTLILSLCLYGHSAYVCFLQDAFVGTAEYVSPEVLRDKPAHAPADLWSLGVLTYQLLAGE